VKGLAIFSTRLQLKNDFSDSLFFLFHWSIFMLLYRIMASIVGTIPKPVRMVEGTLRVGDSRVSLDTVVYHFNNGLDAAEIQRDYDSMSLAQVHAAIAYYLHNKAQVDAYLAEQEIRQEQIRKRIERDFPLKLTREMLLARKNGEDPNWPG